MAQLTLELEKSEYRLAYKNYKAKCVDIAVNNLAMRDLTLYAKVLDMAMIEYHEERMGTINKSMKKLWDLKYTGTDTTSIQIRMEATTDLAATKSIHRAYALRRPEVLGNEEHGRLP